MTKLTKTKARLIQELERVFITDIGPRSGEIIGNGDDLIEFLSEALDIIQKETLKEMKELIVKKIDYPSGYSDVLDILDEFSESEEEKDE